MTVFTGRNFTIYSGSKGDVIVRDDGIWIELRGKNTVKSILPLSAVLGFIM